MAWVESHTVLGRHRKVVLLADHLKIDIPTLVGHLHLLWHAVLEQQEDGDLSQWSDSVIAHAALWKGDASVFVSSLRQYGWIDGVLVHDWLDYVGEYLMRKYHSSDPQKLVAIWKAHGYKYGKGKGKYGKIQGSKKEVNSQSQVRLPNLTLPNPSSPNPSSPNPSEPNLTKPEEEKKKSCGKVKTLPAPAKSSATWEAYKNAYEKRYKIEPKRNERTSSLLCMLVDRLGVLDAPAVAEFYLTHNGPLYVRCRHPPNLLVQDAEGLYTQWKTGQKATTSEIRQAELKDDARDQVKRVEAMLTKGGL